MSNTKCCTNGDVRGMCFTCIGNLEDMTAETIIRVRKCPNRDYAIAYWIENNHGCEKYYERYGIWADEFQENEYLALLNPNWSWINDAIYEIEHDDEDSEEEEEEKEEITGDTCPICYIKYGEQEDGSFICQDGIYNSDMGKESLCDHSVCERCAKTLYNNLRKKEDEDASECCPLCREDWTTWLLSHYNDEDSEEEEEEKEEITDDNIITGIICKKCNTELPPHIVAQHLDVSHPIHICPHTH